MLADLCLTLIFAKVAEWATATKIADTLRGLTRDRAARRGLGAWRQDAGSQALVKEECGLPESIAGRGGVNHRTCVKAQAVESAV